MKRLFKKAGLSIVFLQVLFLNQAYADKADHYGDILYFIGGIVLLPAIIALILLLFNLNNKTKALIFVTIVWLLSIPLFLYLDSLPFLFLFTPVTRVEVVTIIIFMVSKILRRNKLNN